MGVLGEDDPERVVGRLRKQAAAYASLDPSRPVTPALELIESVAKDEPSDNGLYLYHEDSAVVDQFTKLANDNALMLILDDQIGRSTPQAEAERLLPRLSAPNVQLALDPEFAMPADGVPGRDLGSVDADQINQVQAMLEDVAVRNGLPFKILLVHLFQADMIRNVGRLRTYPHVNLVLDADGFGTREMKLGKYEALIASRPAGNPGIKLFYQYDPDIWSPADVLRLNPPPDVVIYQ